MTQQFLKLSFGKPDLKMAMESFTQKGFFPMDTFEETLVKGFESEGIDLRSKVLGDGSIPLYVIASNLTKGIPTVFHKNVPVLSALKASCCIPLLFRPQVLYGQVYVDGGLLANRMAPILFKHHRKEALILNLMTPHHHIQPSELKDMSPMDYIYRMYKTLQTYEHVLCDHPHKIGLEYSGVTSVSELSDEQKQDMILTGRSLVRN
jgi:predicted acylesterase/phospholipase RssA